MRLLYATLSFCLLLGFQTAVLPATAQTVGPTAGPPGAALWGAIEHEGALLTSGRSGGLFVRDGAEWSTEPVSERLGQLLATHEALFGVLSSSVYRSDDGRRWTPAFEGAMADVSATADSVLVLRNDTLYISADGLLWREALRGRSIVDDAGLPTGDSLALVLAAMQDPGGGFWVSAFTPSRLGLFRSEDGDSWRDASSGLPTFVFPTELLATSSGARFYLADRTIYVYDDEAETWVDRSDGLPASAAPVLTPVGDEMYALVRASNSATLYRFDGTGWTEDTLPTANAFQIAPAEDGLFVLTYDGLYRRAEGEPWEALHDGLLASAAQPFVLGEGIAAVSTSSDRSWARSGDGGETWAPLGVPPEVRAIYDLGSVVIGTTPDGLYRSTDAGASWQAANTGINVGPFHARNVRDVRRHEGTIYAALLSSRRITHQGGETLGGVYRSTDDGQSWQLLAGGYPTNPNGFSAGATRLAATDTHVLASTEVGLLRRAHQGGGWEPVPTPVAAAILEMESDGSRVVLASYDELFLSDDNGTSWTPFAAGLPDASTRRTLAERDGEIVLLLSPFLDEVAGLYRLAESGWEDLQIPVPTWPLWTGLVVRPEGLYLGTANHGIWYADPRGVVTGTEPTEAARPALAVYPNPAPGSASLTLTLPQTADARIDVLDATGRVVARIHEGPLAGGTPHRFTLGSEHLAAGVYRLRVQGAGMLLTHPLTVVR